MALSISEQPKSSLLSEVSPSHRTLKEVLQLRLQRRRSREQQDIMPPLKDLSILYTQQQNVESMKPEDTLRPKIQARTQPTDVVKMNILRDAMACPVRVKRTCLPDDLEGTALRLPAPLEGLQKNILPNSPAAAQAPHGSLAAGQAGASDGGVPFAGDGVRDAAPPPVLEATGPPQRAIKGQRPRKVKDAKPKPRKLKYHEYVPPTQKLDSLAVPSEAAYSQLLQQQQVFLQLHILSQQQHTLRFQPLTSVTSGLPGEQIVGLANAVPTPVTCVPLSPLVKSCLRFADHGTAKPELLPTNLDELTVSELRQQLRKRGLPVSGTKPVLLERLRPFQVYGPSLGPLPAPGAGRTPLGEDGGPAESDQAIQRLTWTLEVEQRQADGLRRELETCPRAHSQPGAPAPNAEAMPNLEQPILLDSGPPSSSTVSDGAPPQDGYLPDLLGAHPIQMDFSYSPSSLPPFFTLDESDIEARTESSSEERFESEVYLCDCLGSEKGEHSSLDTFDYCNSGAFQSLDDELTEAIQNAQLSHSQSIEDILKEHLMETDSPPSHASPIGSSPHLGVGEPLAPPADALEGPLGTSPGSPGGGGRSPLTFDPTDWLEPLPGASPGEFRAVYIEAPELSVDLLVGQW